MFSGVHWNQPVYPSVRVSVGVSICVQNISLCQSACGGINPLPDNKILDWSKLKQIADDILKCI